MNSIPGNAFAILLLAPPPPTSPRSRSRSETGIRSSAEAQFARAVREGIRPDGRIIGPTMPSSLQCGLSDRNVAAVVAYLRSLARRP